MAADGSRAAVFAALIGNSVIAVLKFIAAFVTSSAAMFSEAYHSVADVGNQLLLVRGMSVAKKPASPRHPFGRGKEVYFWSFMVAVMLFVGGAVLSFNHGIDAILHPHEVESPAWNFAVLGIAFVIEFFALRVAVIEFNRHRGSRSVWSEIRRTTDSMVLVVLLEDAAAMAGLALAAIGLTLALVTGNPVWDGVAALTIAALLAGIAIVLAIETKALLVGEAAHREQRAELRARVLGIPEVESIGRLLSMHMGPSDILVNIDLDLTDGLADYEVEAIIDRVESEIREVLPTAKTIFVELESRTGA